MTTLIRVQLSIMMFLEFFIWGAWYSNLGNYLSTIGFSGTAIGSAYSTAAWGAIVSPFFIGLIADRFFSAERVLGVMHLIGAVLLYACANITEPVKFFWVLTAYTVCYMPTLALVNAVSFNQMSNIEAQFPSVRVLGTFGWIVIGQVIGYMLLDSTNIPFKIAAAASLAMGVYSFSLPNTPPRAQGRMNISEILGLDTLKLMKDRSFAIFVISSFLISIPLAFYYSFTNEFLKEVGISGPTAKMTWGQVSEMFFLLLMPFLFARLGVKKMLVIAMLFWTGRYFLFAYGNGDNLLFMLYLGILFHGICYDFFFVTGQIYVDNAAPAEYRANAQGFIALVTYGLGMLIGTNLSGIIVDRFKLANPTGELLYNWTSVWLWPGIMALVIAALFSIFFKENRIILEPAIEEVAPPVLP